MNYHYGEFTGEPFPTPDDLFSQDQLIDLVLQYGEQALNAIQQMLAKDPNSPQSQLIQDLINQGLLDKDGKGRLQLTPRAIGRMQQKALAEVFANLAKGAREGHEKITAGAGGQRIEGTKPYAFGDPVSEIDLGATLRNAMQRQARAGTHSPSINLAESDFELHLHDGLTSCSTVVLLDQSGSMMRYGRFLAAKKVAMAMQALVRSRFPQDSIDFVGFYSGANRISESQLPLMMPKPVTIYDYSVRMKVRADQIDKAPQHFTNLHLGLQMARRILQRRASENKQIFIITDGQPTAHVEGDFIHLIYPPHEKSTVATLKEALLAVREGCRLATFALIEDYEGMEWVGFVDQLTKLTKGLAFYTTGNELSHCIMESYLAGKRKKKFLA